MYKNILKTSAHLIIALFVLVSCDKKKEEFQDNTNIVVADCDGMLNITIQTPSGDVEFNTVSSAHLYKDSCPFETNSSNAQAYNYMVLTNEWMEEQADHWIDMYYEGTSDGFNGISFASGSLPQNGDQLFTWHDDALYVPEEYTNPVYRTEFLEVTIIEASETEGEYVRGVIGGILSDWVYDPVTQTGGYISYPVTGDFCVPLTVVCE